MYIVASLIGFLVALVTWFAGSYLVAQFIYWGSTRQPNPIGAKALRAYEIILCGIVFIISATFLILVARSLWPEH